MIIAYYPGAGGNRYMRLVLNKNWQQLGQSYDKFHNDQHYQYRYLTSDVPVPQSTYTLTHCLNTVHIYKALPPQPIVFIKSDMKASLRRLWVLQAHHSYLNKNAKRTASRLEHYLAIRDPSWPIISSESEIDNLPDNVKIEVNANYRNLDITAHTPGVLAQLTKDCVDKINSAYETISWHKNYYQLYPVDLTNAQKVIDISSDNDEFCVLMRQELDLYQSELFDQVWDKIYA